MRQAACHDNRDTHGSTPLTTTTSGVGEGAAAAAVAVPFGVVVEVEAAFDAARLAFLLAMVEED